MNWCCPRAHSANANATMGAALSQEGTGAGAGAEAAVTTQPTMADVIRERKKKAGGAALGTLRRRLAVAARRTDKHKQDRDCEHARFIRSVVSRWKLAEVFALCEELEAGAALRDLTTQAELAREPANGLAADLATALRHRWWCDVQLVGAGYCIHAHRALLAARCTYFRELLARHPSTAWVVPLEGAGATLSRDEMEAVVAALYGSCHRDGDWQCPANSDDELNSQHAECRCKSVGSMGGGGGGGAFLRRLGAALGFSADTLQRDMTYLLDSGEYSDARLVFRGEGEGCEGRPSLELRCHRLVLAARSRYFRSMMCRRGGAGGAGGVVCDALSVDSAVLPDRVAHALLHAAYTDQVDLSLVTPSASSNGSGACANSTNNVSTNGAHHMNWPSLGSRNSATSRSAVLTKLEDAFALYEIARFLEMPIVVQGCEDAIVGMLSPHTLPAVVRWAACSHASAWVQRQAMRYLLDNFPACLSSPGCESLPLSVVTAALASDGLQAAEGATLRAVLRWAAARQDISKEPNVVWHTAHSGRRRGGRARRGEGGPPAGLSPALSPLLAHVRMGLVPADMLVQLVRRGVLPPCEPALAHSAASPSPSPLSPPPDAWLGRNGHPPPRCFLPYLDELKALLEDQVVPEVELQRVRRARCVQPIPDTLYMVSSVGGTGSGSGSGSGGPPPPPLPPLLLSSLRCRCAVLSASPAAQRALRLHSDTARVYTQIALRAVREMSLPDACADLLLIGAGWSNGNGAQSGAGNGNGNGDAHWPMRDNAQPDCCRGPSPRPPSLSVPLAGPAPSSVPPPSRLPDIALPPNANTHLLTARDYFRPNVDLPLLQLDLGDGATHTPRPGSRAQRAATHSDRLTLTQRRDHAQMCMTPARSIRDEEMRAAIEMSGIRAYNSLQPGCSLGMQHRSDSNAMQAMVWLAPPPPSRRPHPSHAHPLRRDHLHTDHRDCRLAPSASASASSYTSSANSSRNPSPHTHTHTHTYQ